MKILIVIGGGGHFAPALAVIEKIPKDTEIVLVGRKYALEGDKAISLEYQTAKQLGIPFISLTTGRLQRKFTRHTLTSLLKVSYGLTKALGIVKREKPDVVLSFGGYIAVPIVFAAYILKIPAVIHEQTLEAGAANKMCALFAKAICISFETSKKYFPPRKTIFTGNPVKSNLSSNLGKTIRDIFPFTEEDMKLPLLYITGGSLGSHAINLLIQGCLEELLTKFRIIHQTGDAKQYVDFDRLGSFKEKLSNNLKKRYMLAKFINPEDIVVLLHHADIVISRSGINTVLELLYFGKPALLIPLPISQKNEQIKNALFFEQTGLGITLSQKSLTPKRLYEQIVEMSKNINQYKDHAKSARRFIIKDAVERVLAVLHDITKKT